MSAGPDEPASTSAQRVFISYRRQDSAAYAGRVYDAMVARFGERHVFMDLELAPGVDFVERITEAVSACQVLIEVMGPTWATVKNEEGQVRIADPEDFVRLELEIALKRPEVTVIPVLVSGAEMPDRRDLPPELGAISRRNALELSDRRWRYDVGQLIDALEELLAGTTAVHATPTSADVAAKTEASPEGAPTGPARIPAGTADPGRAGKWLRGRGRLFAGVAALAVLAVVLAIVTLGGGSGGGGKPDEATQIERKLARGHAALEFMPFTMASAFTVDVPAGLHTVQIEKQLGGGVINTELQGPEDASPAKKVDVQIVQDPDKPPQNRSVTAGSNRTSEGRLPVTPRQQGVADHPDAWLLTYEEEQSGLGLASVATYFFNASDSGWRTRAAVPTAADHSAELANEIATAMALTLEPR